MPGTLGVWLDDLRVGSLTNLSGDYNVFAFDDDYREDRERPILSQSLVSSDGTPLRVVPRRHTLAPPFFANALPEPDSLLRSLLARQHGINRIPDFGFLRALGGDLPGAVRLLDEGATPETLDGGVERASASSPMKFSLAGVQLKFSASMTSDRLTIPVEGGTWIVKLPAAAFPRLPENEYAVMGFASAIGLRVPRIELVDLARIDNLPDGLPALRRDEPRVAYAIERFDRSTGGGRVHGEDFNQIAGQFPAEKYDGRTMDWIASVTAQLCPSEDLEELIARVVFGVAVGNGDAHLKNWGVVYPDGRNARLSPLYDVISTIPYFPNDDLALSVGGEKRLEPLSSDALATFAGRAEISAKMTKRIARETLEKIGDLWPTYRGSIRDESLVRTLDERLVRTCADR